MKKSEFAVNSPQTFINFRCSEKESKMQGWSQTDEESAFGSFSPDTVAETIEIPETDTSPLKTITLLQSVQLGIDVSEGVFGSNVDPVSSARSGGL